jgi:molecular chaperone GrpE
MLKQNKKVKHDQEEKKEEVVVEEETELSKLKKQVEEYLDGWKRCQADFENYKKMQIESQREFVKYAGQNIVLQIIPVLDNFHMSTDHIPKDQKDGGWVVGIMHIQKQLENVLAENGATEIETKVGDKFNPEIHEAVKDSSQSIVHSSEKEKNDHEPRTNNQELVKKVVLKGYKMGNKIIRPVKVIVG